MRLVTILILITLAAAAYVANFAATDQKQGGDSPAPVIAGQELAVLGTEAALRNGANGSGDRTSGGEGTSAASESNSSGLPPEFPSELTMRSGGSNGKAVSQAESIVDAQSVADQTEALGDEGPKVEIPKAEASGAVTANAELPGEDTTGTESVDAGAPTRRRVVPSVRQPSAEENAQRDRLVAERFGSKPENIDAAPVAVPEVTEITLPARTPARERPARPARRTVELAEIDENVAELEVETVALEAAVKEAAAKVQQAPEAMAADDSTAHPVELVEPVGAVKSVGAPEPAASTEPTKVAAVPATAALRAKVIDSAGRVIPNVEVAVISVVTDRAALLLTSGADGIISADVLSPGHYRLQVGKDSVPLGISSPIGAEECRVGTELAGYGSVCVELKADDTTVLADIVLPLSSGVQGTILGKTGGPIEGVLVRAISQVPGFEEHRAVAETNDKGFFFFGLVPGPYELQMLLPGKGRPEELTRSMEILAKPGSALLLDAVDFSKKAPERQSNATQPAVEGVEPARVASPVEPAEILEVAPVAKPAAQLAGKPATEPEETQSVAEAAYSIPAPPGQVTLATAGNAVRSSISVDPELTVLSTISTTDDPEDQEAEGKPGRVELRGRVISKWGESVPALSVIAESPEGRVLEATQTSDNGQYILEDLPIGPVIVRVASDLVINREGRYGTTLLKRPEPIHVQTFEGQKRVSLKDVVVDVRRIYRLSGRIKVQAEAIAEFKESLGRANKKLPKFTDDQLRRMYYRGLRLTQKNKGSESDSKDPLTALGQAIKIQYDGSFVWTCPLPAEDIVLVLEPRSSRKSTGYAGPIGIPVTPAGVRPAELEIAYPPLPTEKPADKPAGKPAGSPAEKAPLDSTALAADTSK